MTLQSNSTVCMKFSIRTGPQETTTHNQDMCVYNKHFPSHDLPNFATPYCLETLVGIDSVLIEKKYFIYHLYVYIFINCLHKSMKRVEFITHS